MYCKIKIAIQNIGGKMKYNKNSEILKKIKNDQIQIRINTKDKENLKRIAKQRNFKNLTDYILYLVMKDISQEELKKLK